MSHDYNEIGTCRTCGADRNRPAPNSVCEREDFKRVVKNVLGYDVVFTSPAEALQELAAKEADRADIKAHIADKAKAIVTGARRSAYGTPEQNFERIARFWQAYFENTGRGDVKITAADVSPMMRLMKEARLCETPDHYDSHVDLVGYTLTGAEINGVKVQP